MGADSGHASLAFSKTTNGRKLLTGIDMRSKAGRRFRDLVESYRQGLGPLSEEQMSLVRTAAGIGVTLEAMLGASVNGEAVDTRLLIRLANSQARALRAISEARAKAQAQAAGDPGSRLRAHLAQLADD
jgi:hypothetical protein